MNGKTREWVILYVLTPVLGGNEGRRQGARQNTGSEALMETPQICKLTITSIQESAQIVKQTGATRKKMRSLRLEAGAAG